MASGNKDGLPLSKSLGDGQVGHVVRLRLMFMLPLVFIVITLISVQLYSLYDDIYRGLDYDVMSLRDDAQNFYDESVQRDSDTLNAVLTVLMRNQSVEEALTRQDRQALLKLTKPIFDELKRNYRITHLYFHTPERVNLLRVHVPNRHGDLINRITMRRAYESGVLATGIELGPLGTYTLRSVAPWFNSQQQLIGYIEVGVEIDQILSYLRNFFHLNLLVLVHKSFLHQEGWEEGMRTLGLTPHWDEFPDTVISHQFTDHMQLEWLRWVLNDDALLNQHQPIEGRSNDETFRIISLPLSDASGVEMGHLVLLVDITGALREAKEKVVVGSAITLTVGGGLLIFFYCLTGQIGRRITWDESELARLATHDGLTGLLNHRVCYNLLDEEGARSQRYGHPFSILMIDIDHFKRVNDRYGHQVGDFVLQEISALLSRHVRGVDKVCRYGGEEILIILPETAISEALGFADRLRRVVMTHHFTPDSKALDLMISVSIGVAASPPLASGDSALLVDRADKALYRAKQGGRNRVEGDQYIQDVEKMRN